MSDKLLSTAPGGESTNYESKNSINVPSDKQGGQMGEAETQETSEAQLSTNGVSGSDMNQKIAAKGAGGHTTTSTGSANTDEGFGGTADDAGAEGTSAEGSHAFQGGDPGVDKTVGG